MNSIVGWNSLSRAGKLSPEGDFSKFKKSAGGGFAAEGSRNALRLGVDLIHSTPRWRRYLESRL
jgi:hypothetical protein